MRSNIYNGYKHMQEHTAMSDRIGIATDAEALKLLRDCLRRDLEREPGSLLIRGYLDAVDNRLEQLANNGGITSTLEL